MLAAVDAGSGCVCQIARRVQTSSVVFLPLQRRHMRDALHALSADGLVTPVQRSQCDSGCDTAYSLSPRGQQMLDSFLDEMGQFEIAIRRKRTIMNDS
ncbi:MAG TPA: hypothetical protein VFY10_02015 [Dehalococcoidia bacterium]|nr:hypothetical protein [Dehalococcoidia bacterium]